MYHPFTYPEAIVIGLVQGVTELFPISSLGHSVIIPALVGGSWAQDLNVSADESPYLAFIVGLHVATAAAMILYFWRDWVRIITGFFGSLAHVVRPAQGTRRFEPQTAEQRLAWMIILATIPVGIAGLALEHDFRVYFSKPVLASIFLAVNGLILFSGEAVRRRRAGLDVQQSVEDRQMASVGGAGPLGGSRHSSGQRAMKQQEANLAVQADRRIVRVGWLTALGLGASQILALLPGISRDGTVMVCGMFRGLSRQDAARFSFLLSAPVILAAGMLKIPDLTGPLGNGVRGQVIAGSVVSFVAAYLALRFLMRYFAANRPLTPFAVYCLVAGIGCAIYLGIT
jgi:undecaprenyl-diphosphatase